MKKAKKKTQLSITATDKNRLKKAFKEMEELSDEMNVLYNDVAQCANKLLSINWYVHEIVNNIQAKK